MDAVLEAMTVVLYERVLYLGKLKPYSGEKGVVYLLPRRASFCFQVGH